MNTQTMLALIVIGSALTACRGGSSGGDGYAPAGAASSYDVAWDQGYSETQNSGRPAKTYELLDYTRELYFKGNATISQTQQRLALILQTSRVVRVSNEQLNRFTLLATDARPEYRNRSSKQLLTRGRRH